jgi:hypothetical protein
MYLGSNANHDAAACEVGVKMLGEMRALRKSSLATLARDPKNSRAWASLARTVRSGYTVNVGGKNYTKRDCNLKALELDQNDNWAWNGLAATMISGETVMVAGKRWGKRECILRSLELDPTYNWAWINLGSTMDESETVMVAGKPITKGDCKRKALELSPNKGRFLGRVLNAMPDGETVTMAGKPYVKQDGVLTVVENRPQVTVQLLSKKISAGGEWNKVSIEVENRGQADATQLSVKIGGTVISSGNPVVPNLKMGEKTVVSVRLKTEESGFIPFVVTIDYQRLSDGKAFSETFEPELIAEPRGPEKAAPPRERPEETAEKERVPPSAAPARKGALPSWPMTPLTTVETVDVNLFWEIVGKSGVEREKLLLLCVEAPGTLGASHGLSGASFKRLANIEGEDNLNPGDVDRIAVVIEDHLQRGPGRSVAIRGIERVVDRAGLKNTARLLQVACEVAESTRGAIIVCLDPSRLTMEERRRLEEDAQVLRIGSDVTSTETES